MNGRQTFNASVVDYVFAERDRLEKENRKLRNELAVYKGSEAEDVIEYLRQECASFEGMYRAEASANARLRELAKEAMKVAHELCWEYSAPCSLCAVDRCDTGCKLDWIDKLARELGIEVGA